MDVLAALIKEIETERDSVTRVYSPQVPYDWCIAAIKRRLFMIPVDSGIKREALQYIEALPEDGKLWPEAAKFYFANESKMPPQTARDLAFALINQKA